MDYLSFYYCSGGTQIHDFAGGVLSHVPHWLKLPLLLVWTVLLFAAIGAVADRFFAPAVEKIAKRLNLSEDVAGATLLAFGGTCGTSQIPPTVRPESHECLLIQVTNITKYTHTRRRKRLTFSFTHRQVRRRIYSRKPRRSPRVTSPT